MAWLKRLFQRRRRCHGPDKAADPSKKAGGDPSEARDLQPLPLAPMKTGDVIILGECFDSYPTQQRGDLVQHYGKTGTVVACCPSDSSKLLQVELKEDDPNQQPIQWPRSMVVSLTTKLGDDNLSHVFSFLGESEASQRIFASRKKQHTTNLLDHHQDNNDDHDHNNKRPVYAMSSIRDIARLHHRLGRVCKRWKQVCDDRLASIRGLVDANLIPTIGCNQLMLPALEWMCQYRLHIRSMRFCNAASHAPLIKTLLNKQDTTNLRELHVFYGTPQASDQDLAQAIANECNVLEYLHIRDEHVQYSDPFIPRMHVLSPKYIALPIKRLVLHADRLPYQWTELISGMESLQHLQTIGSDYSSTTDYIQIKSATLLSLDLTEFRGYWTFCHCPKLETFSCTSAKIFDHGWRQGVQHSGSLPILSRSQFDGLPSNVAADDAGLVVAAGAMPFVGIQVPPSCVINLGNFPFRNAYYDGFGEYLRCLEALQQSFAMAGQY